jgi:hypothetical protein
VRVQYLDRQTALISHLSISVCEVVVQYSMHVRTTRHVRFLSSTVFHIAPAPDETREKAGKG